MKILSTEQIRKSDAYTIEHEPILSINLMERASAACTKWLRQRFPKPKHFKIFVGPGNNGGDGLAIARMLDWEGYSVHVFLLSERLSPEAATNLERLDKQSLVSITRLRPNSRLPEIMPNEVVVDALFGSGLSKVLTGHEARLVQHINRSKALVVSIDLPSGLLWGDPPSPKQGANVVRATHTLKLQAASLSFFLPESAQYVGQWHILDIGLDKTYLESLPSQHHCTMPEEVAELLPTRDRFAHKGNFGHALLVAGSQGKMGAALLAAKAALRAGAGLLTAHLPKALGHLLYMALPEAMLSLDAHPEHFSNLPELDRFQAVGFGPGLGMAPETAGALAALLERLDKPCVADADALNLMAAHRELLDELPKGSILTPHPKEFARLAGREFADSLERLEAARAFARQRQVVLVLKGAYSAVIAPDGQVHFNSTGNPGMATAGSGDVLAGMLLGLLAQGFEPLRAAKLGVFLHGLAGDLAKDKLGQESMLASDLIEHLPAAFLQLHQQKALNAIPEK